MFDMLETYRTYHSEIQFFIILNIHKKILELHIFLRLISKNFLEIFQNFKNF